MKTDLVVMVPYRDELNRVKLQHQTSKIFAWKPHTLGHLTVTGHQYSNLLKFELIGAYFVSELRTWSIDLELRPGTATL